MRADTAMEGGLDEVDEVDEVPRPAGSQPAAGILAYELGAWIPVALCAAVFALVLAQILAFNDGHLVYALDDSYIGYALAEEIARGNYGINPGEPSSPASTLLWPFLLAPLLGLPGGIWLPLALNVACVLIAVYTIYVVTARTLRDAGLVEWRALATFAAVASMALLNLTLITFSGMEHGAQILLAVLVAAGMIAHVRAPERAPPGLLVAALVLGPLIRFEAMALTAPALLVLWGLGHRRLAVGTGLAVATPIALFVAFLTSLGVGPVPSSLMVRSEHMFHAEASGALAANLALNLTNREGMLMALLVIPVLGVPLDRGRSITERLLGAWLLAVLVLHYCFGQFGYWGRYEPYLWATVLVVMPYLMRSGLVRWVDRVGTAPSLAVTGALVALLSWRYLDYTQRTPLASNDIYIEHYQMNRLATDFVEGPVAVNDVGYVSFGNDGYVLDLWGLTSHDIRLRRVTAGPDPSWMDEEVRKHGIDLAMLYPQWFPSLPKGWTLIGRIRIERFKSLLPEFRTVMLVATRPEAIPELRSRLERLAPEMPQGSRLDLLETPAPDEASTEVPTSTEDGS